MRPLSSTFSEATSAGRASSAVPTSQATMLVPDRVSVAAKGAALTRDDVLAAWQQSADGLGVSSADSETICEWLKRVLRYPHRPITGDAIQRFRESLSHFVKNSQSDFSTPARRAESLNLLRFCCQTGWAKNDADTQDAFDQQQKLAADTLQLVRERITATIPPDKHGQWDAEVDKAIADMHQKVRQHIQRLHDDFLFPAFKGPPTERDRSAIERAMTVWIGKSIPPSGIIPQYGKILGIMQSRDESFKNQLWVFGYSFDSLYTQIEAFDNICQLRVTSRYWEQYSVGGGTSFGEWPEVFRIAPAYPNLQQITTEPTSVQDRP
jgi:hypothetical protein